MHFIFIIYILNCGKMNTDTFIHLKFLNEITLNFITCMETYAYKISLIGKRWNLIFCTKIYLVSMLCGHIYFYSTDVTLLLVLFVLTLFIKAVFYLGTNKLVQHSHYESKSCIFEEIFLYAKSLFKYIVIYKTFLLYIEWLWFFVLPKIFLNQIYFFLSMT